MTSRSAATIRRTAWAVFRSSAIPTVSRMNWRSLPSAGARGIALSFVNYTDELPFFRDEVMPRLARMGLRVVRN